MRQGEGNPGPGAPLKLPCLSGTDKPVSRIYLRYENPVMLSVQMILFIPRRPPRTPFVKKRKVAE